MSRIRLVIGTAGVALGLFGVFRLVTQIPISDLIALAIWLVAAVVIHDGVLSPLILGVGALVSRVLPPRARGFVQAALIASGIVTIIAIPLIARRNSQPKSKAILQQNYAGNLSVLIAIIAAVALVGYAVHVAHDQARSSSRRADNPPDHNAGAD